MWKSENKQKEAGIGPLKPLPLSHSSYSNTYRIHALVFHPICNRALLSPFLLYLSLSTSLFVLKESINISSSYWLYGVCVWGCVCVCVCVLVAGLYNSI